MSDNVKNIMFLILVFAVGGLGFYLYSNEGFNVFNIKENEQLAFNLEKETASFIRKLQVLEGIDLQTELFADPRFTSLKSYATPVPERNVGRTNPFEPAIIQE